MKYGTDYVEVRDFYSCSTGMFTLEYGSLRNRHSEAILDFGLDGISPCINRIGGIIRELSQACQKRRGYEVFYVEVR